MRENFLWVESYRPHTIDDCILPEQIKKSLKEFVKAGNLPNLLLSGPPGIGKTTVAKALCEEIGSDYYVINGSDEGRFLDTVRKQAKNFASTLSLQATGRHKVIIIDEADNTTNDVQLLLRANIETFYSNCRFIFTANFKNKIIEPLHSRCSVIDFTIPGKEKPSIAAEFFNRVREVLVAENIEFEQRVVAEIINKHFPDWRRTLNELQRYSSGGKIDSGILSQVSDVRINDLIKHLSEKNFTEVRKWVVTNLDNDPSIVLRRVYDACYECLSTQTIPAAVLIIAKYQYQSAFVADQEVNLLAALTEIMCECNFK